MWTIVDPEGTAHDIADEAALLAFAHAQGLRSNNLRYHLGGATAVVGAPAGAARGGCHRTGRRAPGGAFVIHGGPSTPASLLGSLENRGSCWRRRWDCGGVSSVLGSEADFERRSIDLRAALTDGLRWEQDRATRRPALSSATATRASTEHATEPVGAYIGGRARAGSARAARPTLRARGAAGAPSGG